MKLRFGLRSLLALTALAALVVAWIAIPIYEKNDEVANLAELYSMVEPGVDVKQRAPGTLRIQCFESIPNSYQDALRRRFHSDETLHRVTRIRLLELTPEIFDQLLRFKYLDHLTLNGTNLTNEQCRKLGSMPHVRVIDCVQTPVRYETLLEMKANNARLCHLAHRRALAELSFCSARPNPDYDSPVKNAISVALTNIKIKNIAAVGDTCQLSEAIKNIGRPVDTVSASLYLLDDLRNPFWNRLAATRSDFRFDFEINQSGRAGAWGELMNGDDFRRMCDDRVAKITCTGLELSDVYEIERTEPFSSVEFNSVGPKLLKSFAAADVKSLSFSNVDLRGVDVSVVPASVERLSFRACSGDLPDLSHCQQLRFLRIDGRWESEDLIGLLELPLLEKVVFHFLETTDDLVREKFTAKGVKLSLVPASRGLPMQSPPLEAM